MPTIHAIAVSKYESEVMAQTDEGQFSDVKSIDIAPGKLTQSMSAFANADGGELFIGVDESKSGGTRLRTWRGFDRIESANGHLQAFEGFFPLSQDFQYEFCKCSEYPGLLLHALISKTQAIKKASNGIIYLRRGAQNLPVTEIEAIRRLEYTKGIASFEAESVNVDQDDVIGSDTTKKFIAQVVPRAESEAWLRKQSLIRDGKPIVAGVLLFADEPQAALPKHCGIKIARYKTKGAEGSREHLAFNPLTVEGSLYDQIRQAVSLTTKTVEEAPRMGEGGLEKVEYPPETLHEIITNAVLHRDYSIADDVHIRIFDNRVEVQSPGRLPAHITPVNILKERFARNGRIVRLLNKFPDPPNKDVGEGLNTAFDAMHKLGLKEPIIEEGENHVLVTIRHEPLATPEVAIMDYLETHESINNAIAREVTHIQEDWKVRGIFRGMERRGMIRRIGGKTSATAWTKKP